MAVRSRLAVLLATWFGAGYCPVAPGTAGSLVAVLMAAAASHWLRWGSVELLIAAAGAAAAGVWAASVVAERSGKEDPGIVVIDEVAGQWITLAGAPAFHWKAWLAAFLLFRLFDIWKPPPVRRLERIQGGAGIVADDIMAGVYGALLLMAAGRWFF